MPWTPRDYQIRAKDFLVDRLQSEKGAGLFLDPGLGKTSTTLAALQELRERKQMHRALIIAPRRVIHNVWPQEIRKWGFPLAYTAVHGGTPLSRERQLLMRVPIHLTTPDLAPWIFSQARNFLSADYDTIVIDESTKFKNWTAVRTKALRKAIKHFQRRIILTGTPASNGLSDLFAQIFLLDDGEALGKSLTQFRSRFCRAGGFQNREWIFLNDRKADLETSISDMVLRLDAKDYLSLPPLVTNDIWVDLPTKVYRQYRQFEKELLLELEHGGVLTAGSAAAAYVKCRQLANGGGYDETTGEALDVHREKVEAIVDLAEELSGKPLLVAYQFRHDLGRLLEAFPNAPVIRGGTAEAETQRVLAKWNAGETPILFVQPQAASHGLNMQSGGCQDVAWVGLPDSLEVYDQFNARVYRQGAAGGVRVHRILAAGTVERAVLNRIERKSETQNSLLDALREYAREREREYSCSVSD